MSESGPGFKSGLTRDGIGYEIHYNVEVNSKSTNRKLSVGLFYQGGVNVAQDQQLLRTAGDEVNQIVFELCNGLENRQRYMNNLPQLDVETGSLVPWE